MVRKIQKKILRERLKTLAWFLIKFNILAIPLYLVMYFNLSFLPFQELLATLSSKVLTLFGYMAEQNGVFISTNIGPIEVSWDSTGWKSMYALAALTIATPIIGWRDKIKFLAAGIPIIFAINYLRIVTTIGISLQFGFRYFDIIHTLLWREGLILAVVGIWVAWLIMKKYKIGKSK